MVKYSPQEQKIIELCEGNGWICQAMFHPISWSPHKRRKELAKKGEYRWEERTCDHGITASKDYLMIELAPKEYTKGVITSVSVGTWRSERAKETKEASLF